MKSLKEIAVVSMVRNDTFFADKWISYYGNQFGFQNLFLFIDGMDQELPSLAAKINCFQIPHEELSRAKGDRKRVQHISKFAKSLFEKYQVVLAMDIDEFLVLDPDQNKSLLTYLSQDFKVHSLSALGLDVGQHPTLELPIDLSKSFLSQRSYAQVSDRYTKPVVALKPLNWGSGFHRVKGKNFTIDSHLFLFHFGLVDLDHATQSTQNEQLLSSGWEGHFKRRHQLYEALKSQSARDGDTFFKVARDYFKNHRKWYAWNKPAPLRDHGVISIPKRFQTLV
ncbi:hypothetical protein OAM55_01070 [Flavobacteriaceae bacterium]|nr:hypothetical protein [Flavobacteriaceae bacterium]MDC0387002.1 hypothetical protein [Flavobacteriaceae bacterium]